MLLCTKLTLRELIEFILTSGATPESVFAIQIPQDFDADSGVVRLGYEPDRDVLGVIVEGAPSNRTLN